MGHSGGSWAIISPWKQQPGVGRSRVGLASAQQRVTLCLAAFLLGFPRLPWPWPFVPGWLVRGKRAPPREVARSRFDKQVAQPWHVVTDPVSCRLLLGSSGKPLRQCFPGRGLCLAVV